MSTFVSSVNISIMASRKASLPLNSGPSGGSSILTGSREPGREELEVVWLRVEELLAREGYEVSSVRGDPR